MLFSYFVRPDEANKAQSMVKDKTSGTTATSQLLKALEVANPPYLWRAEVHPAQGGTCPEACCHNLKRTRSF
jgi:hypothetical protein